jgi:hypothetical protein
VSPYVEKHKEELAAPNISGYQVWINKQHKEKFATWLQQHLLEVRSSDPDLDALAMGPNDSVVMYQGYDINAYTFYTRKQDKKSANQNSGVRIDACYEQNKQMETYYGIKEEIWVLEYGELKVPLFWCK